MEGPSSGPFTRQLHITDNFTLVDKMLSSTFIDELGYVNLKPEQSNIFFKLMEERYRQHPTIITTNLVYDEWPNFLGSRPLVEALLSRLRHYCHTVHIDGPPLREPQG